MERSAHRSYDDTYWKVSWPEEQMMNQQTAVQTRPSPRSSLRSKLLGLMFGALVAFGLAETATRLFVPDPAFVFENRPEFFLQDAIVGYRNQPDYDDYAQGFVHVQTNALGFRGKDVLTEKPPNVIRILGVGDSITWGVGVDDADTFLRVLERRLNQPAQTNSHVFEVINAGVIGYSLHQDLRMVETFGLPLRPDLVIVSLAMNDAYPTEDPFFNLHTFHRPAKENVRRRGYAQSREPWCYFGTYLRSQARMARNRLRGDLRYVPSDRDVWPEGSFEARAWPTMEQHLLDLKRLADEHNFTLLVAIVPTFQQLASLEQAELPQVRICGFLSASGIQYLDLYDALKGGQVDFFRDSMHLSKAGHQVVGDAIFDAIGQWHRQM
jgi:lysophospholipase L1-like esterase